MGCGQKSFKLCHQLLSGLLAKSHLPRVSRRSLMIRVIMKRSRGCARIWHLPYDWGKPRKTSARRQSMKAMRPVIASNRVPFVQMRSVGSHSTPGIEKDGIGSDEDLGSRTFGCVYDFCLQLSRFCLYSLSAVHCISQ